MKLLWKQFWFSEWPTPNPWGQTPKEQLFFCFRLRRLHLPIRTWIIFSCPQCLFFLIDQIRIFQKIGKETKKAKKRIQNKFSNFCEFNWTPPPCPNICPVPTPPPTPVGQWPTSSVCWRPCIGVKVGDAVHDNRHWQQCSTADSLGIKRELQPKSCNVTLQCQTACPNVWVLSTCV